jgi:hypothetical protein
MSTQPRRILDRSGRLMGAGLRRASLTRASMMGASLWLSALLAGPAVAADPASALRQIHAAQLGILETAAAFQSFQGAEGDPRKGRELQDKLAETQTRMASMRAAVTGLGVDTEIASVNENWGTALQSLAEASAAISEEGFAEFAVMNQYTQDSLAAEKTLGLVQARISETTGYKASPTVSLLRSQALLMQTMTTRYVEQSNSQFGATYRGDQADEETIDSMAGRFSRDLEALLKQIPVGSAERADIEQVRSSWTFLEKSFQNYTEKTVPFLVSRFSKEIIDTLGRLAVALEQGR